MHKTSPGISSVPQSVQHSNYKKTVLPNGIRVVSEEIPYVRSISVGVWIEVGSRDEHPGNNGISHFLEHMVFKGTKRYSSQQIARSLEGVGGYLNAFTTKEHTCFYARILDDHLPKAIDVISKLVQHPVFNVREMEKEKKVIIEELKNIEDDPEELVHDYFDRRLFHDHPLGMPIIGRAESIKGFSRDDLKTYRQRHYAPSRMVVSAAGNLKHEKLVDIVERAFTGNGNGRSPLKRTAGLKRPKPDREVHEKPIMQAHVVTGTMGYSVLSKLRYTLLVLNTLLGEGMSSRLFQNIREKYGFAYSIFSFANLLSDTGNFGVYVGTDTDNTGNSLDLIHKELEILRTKPIGDGELRRTKAQLKGTMVLSLESTTNRMTRLGSGELYFGKFVPINRILTSIDAVSIGDVFELAKKLFQVEKFSTVIIKPSGKAQLAARAAVG